MAEVSLATLMILVVIIACTDAHQPIIIGGWQNRPRHLVIGNSSNHLIGVRLTPAALSGMDQVNPFIRNKRQACQMTSGSIQHLRQMVAHLNIHMYLRQIPQQNPEPIMPVNQPTESPRNTNILSSSTEKRLSSNCPCKWTQRDLGANSYPRYVAEAICVCSECIGSALNSCKAQKAPVTYFELQSCQDGIALMVKKIEVVAVGCFCASPSPNSATGPPSSTSINAVDDY